MLILLIQYISRRYVLVVQRINTLIKCQLLHVLIYLNLDNLRHHLL